MGLSEEAVSSLLEDVLSSPPEKAISLPPGRAMSSPGRAMSSPERAGITAAKGLLDLPGEIRNRIYDYVADGGGTFKIIRLDTEELTNRHHYNKLMKRGDINGTDRPSSIGLPSLDLAQLCRKLRAEFRPLFIAQTTFVIQEEDIGTLIDSIILPPDTDVRSTAVRVVIDAARYHFSVDVKPLLHLSQVAKDISFVIKKTHLYYPADEFKDRTIHEIFRIMLRIQDTETFLSFVERTSQREEKKFIPRTLCGRRIWAWRTDTGIHGSISGMCVVKRSSVAGHADFFQRRRIGLLQRKILGTGMKLLYDRRGPRTPINFLKVGEQWQERLNELPWSED
ncbi:hypothetical protein B5807_10034 [Epicoccum nigrum]|uniref:F-box domain-containing protein n=1 Tax=Epicoccum nigrum TaxID=105696 RepID=A0A1Y2LUB5_EPING|nr:hypothetical protein B5807_10034 [Epicoccum nigrum]